MGKLLDPAIQVEHTVIPRLPRDKIRTDAFQTVLVLAQVRSTVAVCVVLCLMKNLCVFPLLCLIATCACLFTPNTHLWYSCKALACTALLLVMIIINTALHNSIARGTQGGSTQHFFTVTRFRGTRALLCEVGCKPCVMDLFQHGCTVADFISLCEPNACGCFLRDCFAHRKEILSMNSLN